MKNNKIKEAVVSFETAKLAKEKGFTDLVGNFMDKNYYNYKGELNGDSTELIKYFIKLRNSNLSIEETGAHNPFDHIAAPTPTILQDWLRNTKGIIIYVFPIVVQFDEVKYFWSIINKKGEILKESLLGFIEWDDAFEEGIKESLNLI